MKYVTCKHCGWVHFARTRDEVDKEVRTFNAFYEAASKGVQEMYGGPLSVAHFCSCFCCGGDYTDFRDFREGDCPDGVTLQPILEFTHDDSC